MDKKNSGSIFFVQRRYRARGKDACRNGGRRPVRDQTESALHGGRSRLDGQKQQEQRGNARSVLPSRHCGQGGKHGAVRRCVRGLSRMVVRRADDHKHLSRKLRFFGKGHRALLYVGRERSGKNGKRFAPALFALGRMARRQAVERPPKRGNARGVDKRT